MKNKISYLVLGAFLMGGSMGSALAAQHPVSEYVKETAFNGIQPYAADVQAFANVAAAAANALQDRLTGIGIGLNNAAFGDSDALADVFGAGALNAAGAGQIAQGNHALAENFQPGGFANAVTNAEGRTLLRGLAIDFNNTFNMEKFRDDLLIDYVSWLGKNLKGDKLTVADVVAIRGFDDNSEKLLGAAERCFQEFLGQYSVKEIVKTHFKDLFEKKIGDAVRRSANAPNIGLDDGMLDVLITRSRLCAYRGGNWDDQMKNAFVSIVNAVKGAGLTDAEKDPIEQIKQNLKDKAAEGVKNAANRLNGVKKEIPAAGDNKNQSGGAPVTPTTVTVTHNGVAKKMSAEDAEAFRKMGTGMKKDKFFRNYSSKE